MPRPTKSSVKKAAAAKEKTVDRKAASRAARAKPAARAATPAPPGASYIALLRGINVGSANRLAMADLVKIFTAAGCGDVRTYIQSGNIAFSADAKTIDGLAARIAQRIQARHKMRIPVVLRTREDVRKVIAGNPFLKEGADADRLHVVFLADEPAKERGAALDPARSPGDLFRLVGREIYLHLPNGTADSRLTNAYFDSTLATISTGRNWRTVLKLAEL